MNLTVASDIDREPASFVRRCAQPGQPYQRFAHLPAGSLLRLIDTLIDLHVALAAAGWVAGDLYDGCLIVDFETPDLQVIDLDSYRRGATTNEMGRMFGSTRFMAPQEFELGKRNDERTTVFTLDPHRLALRDSPHGEPSRLLRATGDGGHTPPGASALTDRQVRQRVRLRRRVVHRPAVPSPGT